MAERAAVALQHGIWIDRQELADAGLRDQLEITIEPGEIRIRSVEVVRASTAGSSGEPLLQLAGLLSGESLTACEIERELYGDGAGER